MKKIVLMIFCLILLFGVSCSDNTTTDASPDGDTGVADGDDEADDEAQTEGDEMPLADGDEWEDEASSENDETPRADGDEVEKEAPLCQIEDDLGAGKFTIDMEFDGQERFYIVYIPQSYDKNAPTPLIVNMHGYTSKAWQEEVFTLMSESAEEDGYIVAYPQGIADSWNAGVCCGDALADDIDDVGFLKAVVDDISGKLCIDPHRVYATGMSNGGFMSNRLACEASDVFAAVAPVTGLLGVEDCSPERPVPIVMYNGVQDERVEYEYAVQTYEAWVGINGCTDEAEVVEYGGSNCKIHDACDAGVSVIFCTMDPMGHCWPGGAGAICEIGGIGPFNDDIDANAHMWEFFQQYRLPE